MTAFDPSAGQERLATTHLLRRVAFLLAGLLIIGIAAWLVWARPGDDNAVVVFAIEQFANLKSFLAEFYDGWDIQILLAMCAIGLGLEKIIPGRRQPMSNTALNIPYSAMILLFVGAIIPLQLFVADTLVEWIGWKNIFGLREPDGSFGLAAATMLIGALVTDFFFYWFHRCQHRVGILWQAHLLHHTDMALNVTTTHRVHFVEHLLTPFFMTAPIMVFFDPPSRDMYWIAVVPTLWSYFVHANLRIGFGKFWWLLSSPQYHRIHHSLLPQHLNRNFAVWFPLYDVLFRTAYAPKRGEYPETGVAGAAVSTLAGAVILPFERWWQMLSRAR